MNEDKHKEYWTIKDKPQTIHTITSNEWNMIENKFREKDKAIEDLCHKNYDLKRQLDNARVEQYERNRMYYSFFYCVCGIITFSIITGSLLAFYKLSILKDVGVQGIDKLSGAVDSITNIWK